MSLFCPSCSKEITPDMYDCGTCGYAFGPDTLSLLTSDVKFVLEETPDERRKYPRVQRRFKVTFSTPREFTDAYLFNISSGGLFVETNDPPVPGEVLNLKVFLPDEKQELDVLGEVVWCARKAKVTAERTYPPGMGVKFLNLSTEDRIRISITILEDNK